MSVRYTHTHTHTLSYKLTSIVKNWCLNKLSYKLFGISFLSVYTPKILIYMYVFVCLISFSNLFMWWNFNEFLQSEGLLNKNNNKASTKRRFPFGLSVRSAKHSVRHKYVHTVHTLISKSHRPLESRATGHLSSFRFCLFFVFNLFYYYLFLSLLFAICYLSKIVKNHNC